MLDIAERRAASIAPNTLYVRIGKRAIDIVLASVGLVITAPVNLALAIGTKIDVGSPILFKQKRLGRYG